MTAVSLANPPPERLARLETPGMPAPWRWWKKMLGASHRRTMVCRMFNDPDMTPHAARRRVRTLVDLGLFDDLPWPYQSEHDRDEAHRTFGFSIYNAAMSGNCDAQMLHMAFEGGLARTWSERNNRNDTWTTIFARTGQDQCLRVCMAAGCDVLVRDTCEDTALHLVLKRACRSADAPARARSLALADEIIQAGHDIDNPGKPSNRFANDKGHPVLQIAVEAGNLEIMRWLLDRGARTDIADGYGDLPLHWLAMTNFNHGAPSTWGNIATLLIEHGASMDKGNARGETPLWLAVAWGNVQAIEWLVSAGADPTIDPAVYRDTQGYEKPEKPPITLLMNVCTNLAPSEPVARHLVGLITNAKPGAWDAPTPDGPSVRKWLSTQAGPWRAVHDKMHLDASTAHPGPAPTASLSHQPRL